MSRSKMAWLVAGTLGCGVTLAACVYLGATEHRPPAAGHGRAAVAGAPASSGGARSQTTQLVYDVRFQIRVTTAGRSAQGGEGQMQWTLARLGDHDGKQRYAATVSGVSLSLGADLDADGELGQRLGEDLEQPFAIELDDSGRVTRLGVGQAAGASTVSLLQNLAGALQFVRAGAGRPAAWDAEEDDHLGHFAAHYQATPANVHVDKRYTALALPGVLSSQGAAKPEVVASATFVLDSRLSRLPSRVDVSEEIRTVMFVSSTTATLRLTGEELVDPASVAGPGELRWLTLGDTVETAPDPAYEAGRKRRLLGDKTFAALLDDLERLPAKGDTMGARHHALAQLRALFDLDPKAIAEAEALLASGKAGDRTAALLGAMSNSDAPEAATALIHLGKDAGLPTELREDAIANLALREAPTPESFAALHDLSGSSDAAVAGAATLGLGAAARAAGPDQGADAERARQQLVEGTSPSHASEDRIVSLQALGNAGGEAALAPAEQALADPSPEVRAAGVAALRFAPAPRADELLARVWREDPSSSVRVAVSTTAGFRPQNAALIAAGIAVLLGDAEARVRLSVLPFLGQLRDDDPRITPALEKTADSDADPGVREAAAQALGQPTGSAGH